MPERVAILGVGLIGGSIALGLKERTDSDVIGFDISAEDLHFAKLIGAIDEGSTELASVVKEADVIIIALPVGKIKQAIDSLCQLPLRQGCIVTDVGSTKSEIVEHARKLKERGITFIGGHPMAGSHRSGVKAAQSLLFENAYYVLTPEPDISISDVQRLSRLLHLATRAELIIMDPVHHDRIVGAISHLPHIIAAGLVNQVGNYNETNEWFHRLAAGGFRDLTRIGASHPIMWRDILLTNREVLIRLMDDWISQMSEFRSAVSECDASRIEYLFERSKKLRSQLPDKKKGILSPRYECYIDVPDRPGVIAKIATLLGNEQINLSNIGVMENREDTPGVLQLSFKRYEDFMNAVICLRKAGYIVFADDEDRSNKHEYHSRIPSQTV
ncbi:prephenate dehydrogenase [Paenactinomyces guangxiensis]|uniref:Prephenate dehydrogenase n=1 Tax=Paenactinomyces guangxiensis TaxID=1490290 RepID=A0A7W2AAC0_9BACL|nr:prephenate dehydrogenase [Paenactinomyces guangxiensis]MBA4496054.1 prephenate dehydrogenase [Paenactinomyces guangxiensis]MBH8593142.1 prephenate dehydrogenase [Paenactinomyces guangxiensis]